MDVLLTRILGIALILSASVTLLRLLHPTWAQDTRREPGAVVTTSLGPGVGIMVGVTSIGAGSLLMAAFALFYKRLPIAKAVGVDIMPGAILALAAAMAHGAAGRIDVPLEANLLMGSLPGVILGSWLCRRLPSRPLRVGIATMLVLAGLRLL
jgi:hypothetical protein